MSSAPPVIDDLQMQRDVKFQQRAWVTQRVGWVVMALLVVAAASGLLGRGPLSRAQAASVDGKLDVEYARLTCLELPTELRVTAVARMGDELRVWLDRDFVERQTVESITPEPESVESADDRFVYTFKVVDGNRPHSVAFHLKPEHPWLTQGRVGVDGGGEVGFKQFVYP